MPSGIFFYNIKKTATPHWLALLRHICSLTSCIYAILLIIQVQRKMSWFFVCFILSLTLTYSLRNFVNNKESTQFIRKK